ncbi:hypothetical protein GGR53DRAFT_513765 [Hypoxylon sp. FL1150]|nr:hypothetical protein GGR53DRAFT_513765 [Hypoxylon sp. FL1150]
MMNGVVVNSLCEPESKMSDDIHAKGYPPVCAPFTNGSCTNNSQRYGGLVAICGMDVRLPGGITTGDQFWRMLVNKQDAGQQVPKDRYNIDGFYSEDAISGGINTNRGYFLDSLDLAHFDPSYFSMARTEVEKLDPQQRLLLELTRECLENAGEIGWQGKNIGCYIGVFGEDWLDIQTRDVQESGTYGLTGYQDFMLADRVSYEYDFKGPSITVKTACSSSLTCLDMAVKAVQTGDITSAIVGGSNLIISPRMTQALTEQGVLSPNGSCRTFDADADGHVRAEAVNMIYIKRLDDALRDRNLIRAVIRSTACNFDGRTPDVAQTAFIECHGTGTKAGDPIETTAVANVFGEKGMYIGSVKPNIGHSEGASGLSSVIKAILALEHKTIPPNIKFSKPNPEIPFEQGRLRVPVDPVPWPTDRQERISVNSFGVGGSNAHIILDSADSLGVTNIQPGPLKSSQQAPHLLVFTGSNAASVKRGADNCLEYLRDNPNALDDLSYTLGAHREHLLHRPFAVADNTMPTLFSAPTKVPKSSPDVIFVFTGQGAQWATMGARLMADFLTVSIDLQRMEEYLADLPEPPKWNIRDELCKEKDTSRVDQAEFSQPLCTAIQIVLVNLLRQWGIFPSAVVGHSSGEIAAAYACGALTMREAVTVAYLRGLAIQREKSPGTMAAVGLGRDDVFPYIVEGVTIACENNPESITLSGEKHRIDETLARVKQAVPNVLIRYLRVERAYHSDHMRNAGRLYEELLVTHLDPKEPCFPFISTVTGNTTSRRLDASYWRSNLEAPVLFHTAMDKALAMKTSDTLLLELGPHSALGAPIGQVLKTVQANTTYLPTLLRNENDTISILRRGGQLFLKGLQLNFGAINPNGKVLTDLPTHPWQHDTKYWHESRVSREWRLRKAPRHELLGLQSAESTDFEPIWRNVLRLSDVPWCRDHVIAHDVVFPAAVYITMAGEAVRQYSGASDYSVRNLSITTAMILQESNEMIFSMRPVRLTTSLDSAWFEFTILSYNGASWTKHCTGQVKGGTTYLDKPRDIIPLPRKVKTGHWYTSLRKIGMAYGPCFQGLKDISAHPLQNLAAARVVDTVHDGKASSHFHPTMIDSCLQIFLAAASRGQSRHFSKFTVLPTSFDEIYVKPPSGDVTIEVNAEVNAKGAISGTCLGTSAGEVVLQLRNVKLSPLRGNISDRGEDPHAAVHLVWKPDIDLAHFRRPTRHRMVEGGTISLLSRDPSSAVSASIYSVLSDKGFVAEHVGLESEIKQDVISILDLEGSPFLEDISVDDYNTFKDFVMRLSPCGLLWITKPCQIQCLQPQYAQILGLARTLRHELSVDIATLEVDENPVSPESLKAICDVYQKFRARPLTRDGDMDLHYEYALSRGAIHIPQFLWVSVGNMLSYPSDTKRETSKQLEVGKEGTLNGLRWVTKPLSNLEGKDVRVEVRAVGMNFKDVLVAMGVVEGHKAEGGGLGYECSGVIKEVGPSVSDLEVGDRVLVGALNTYTTTLKTTSDHCIEIPDDLSFEEAATMPCVYGTVIHSLLELGRLQKGQSILIHSACGGIGIAAIHVSRMIGAKIYATVGNEEKVGYLMENFGIPREHIFNSRDASFLPGIMGLTSGRGVDVVLNSLSGDLLHTSWRCVADFGSMIELGKRDIIGQGQLAMDMFQENRSFHSVDLGKIYFSRPGTVKRILQMCMEFYAQGAIKPIGPTRCFEGAHVEDALRIMQKGQHIGKFVIRMPQDSSILPCSDVRDTFSIREDASYLLIGGLGGLGRVVSSWLAEKGAKNLVVSSRSTGNSPETASLIQELASLGCSVQIVTGSVSQLDDVYRAVRGARLPIRGVIQMAMVLRDGAFEQMSYEDWQAAISPKVSGTWNLHTACSDQELDFFVLFSSISGIVGNLGQANYASANTFLDAFVQFRHGNGLPASVLDIGAMDDVGYVSQNQSVMEHIKAKATYLLKEQDLLDALELAIKRSRPLPRCGSDDDGYSNESQVGLGFRMTQPISSPSNRSVWKRDVRMRLYRDLEANANGTNSGADAERDDKGHEDALRNLLAAAPNNPQLLFDDTSLVTIARAIGATLSSFLMKPAEEEDMIDLKMSPAALGLDSLVAVELRNWCRQRVGVQVSVLEIVGAPSLEVLGSHVRDRLRAKLHAATDNIGE